MPAKILGTRQYTTLNQRAVPVRVVRIEFMVGESGPFYVETPADGFRADVARAAVDKYAAELEALEG